MADWTAPFHLPKFTDEEFEKRKDAYVKEHGYAIDVPVFGDIIKLKPFKPLTSAEAAAWKKKDYGSFAPERLEEIQKEKADKKRRYLTMLASPSPKIVRDAGAILTSLDDLQDAVSTLACLGMIAAVVVGGPVAAALAGPLGWVIGGSELLRMINPYSRIKGKKGKAATGRGAKKHTETITDKNPFSKTARAKYAKNIRRFRPSLANAIEAAQVTSGIFGIGLSLGPLMGFAQDVLAGAVRTAKGERVKLTVGGEPINQAAAAAAKTLRSAAVANGSLWFSDVDKERYSFMAANLACQVIAPYVQGNNPFKRIRGLAKYQVAAPEITDPLWIEIFEEAGHTKEEYEIWPQNGQRWISYYDLQEKTATIATANLVRFAEKNCHDPLSFVAGQNAHDFALGSIEAIEGIGKVSINYSIYERIVLSILDAGWCYPDDITDAQVQKFEDWCYVQEIKQSKPTPKDIKNFAETYCGFSWAKSPDEYR